MSIRLTEITRRMKDTSYMWLRNRKLPKNEKISIYRHCLNKNIFLYRDISFLWYMEYHYFIKIYFWYFLRGHTDRKWCDYDDEQNTFHTFHFQNSFVVWFQKDKWLKHFSTKIPFIVCSSQISVRMLTSSGRCSIWQLYQMWKTVTLWV